MYYSCSHAVSLQPPLRHSAPARSGVGSASTPARPASVAPFNQSGLRPAGSQGRCTGTPARTGSGTTGGQTSSSCYLTILPHLCTSYRPGSPGKGPERARADRPGATSYNNRHHSHPDTTPRRFPSCHKGPRGSAASGPRDGCERRAENVARGGRKPWRPVSSGYSSPAPASMGGSAGLAASLRRRRRASLSR